MFRIDRRKTLIISLSLVFVIVFASTIVTAVNNTAYLAAVWNSEIILIRRQMPLTFTFQVQTP
jgi:hypothetical protein